MIVLDVNVLITAFWPDAPGHPVVSGWLTDSLRSGEAVGVPDLVVTAFLRLVTNHRVFKQPAAPSVAVEFLDAVLTEPTAGVVTASARYWPLLRDLVVKLNLRANDLPDAHLAAITLDQGGVLATSDRGFSRFPGLRLVEPVLR